MKCPSGSPKKLLIQSEMTFNAMKEFIEIKPDSALLLLIDLRYFDSYAFHGFTPKLNGYKISCLN